MKKATKRVHIKHSHKHTSRTSKKSWVLRYRWIVIGVMTLAVLLFGTASLLLPTKDNVLGAAIQAPDPHGSRLICVAIPNPTPISFFGGAILAIVKQQAEVGSALKPKAGTACGSLSGYHYTGSLCDKNGDYYRGYLCAPNPKPTYTCVPSGGTCVTKAQYAQVPSGYQKINKSCPVSSFCIKKSETNPQPFRMGVNKGGSSNRGNINVNR